MGGQTRPDARRRHPGRPWSDRGDPAALGVDVGATKTSFGAIGPDGVLWESETIATPVGRPPAEFSRELTTRIEQRWGRPVARTPPLGIGVAGQVGPDGTVTFAPHLDWHDVPLRALLAAARSGPVTVLNDVQAATFGEWRYGAGRGLDNLVALFLGTGVGGGMIVDGELWRGAGGCAGEFGHLMVERGGRPCPCGSSGCLDAYVGGAAIAGRAREAVLQDPTRGRRLSDLAGGPGSITAETVVRACLGGDALATRLVEETIDHLVDGLVSIVNSVNPQAVVVGGGVLRGLGSKLPDLERRVRSRVLPAAAKGLRVVPASLGAESAVVGAAAFARAEAGG